MNRLSAATACLLALALGACTGGVQDEVTPAPSAPPETVPADVASAAVVLPPRGRISATAADSLERAVELAVEDLDREVELRVVQPDGPEFVAGIAGLLADDGFDLVCVLSESGATPIATLAAEQPGTRFCVVGPVEEAPANLWAPTLRHREAAWLAGVAAALTSGPGPVGMIVREGQPALAAKRASFDLGYAAAAAPQPTDDGTAPPPTVGTIALQDEQPALVVDAVLSQEPSVVVLDVGPLTDEVAAQINDAAARTPVIAWSGLRDQLAAPSGSILIVTELVRAFRMALDAVLAGTFGALPDSLGLADGALSLRSPDPATPLTALQPWIDDVVAGRVDVGGAP